jgi:hypothetical protein
MIIATVSGTITAQASNNLIYFWIGVSLTFILIIVCGFILYSIRNKTKEIGDLKMYTLGLLIIAVSIAGLFIYGACSVIAFTSGTIFV